ncbi:MAG: site-specific DNA-methyltransferase [Phycisphaerae bacterium]|jgi:adenine-specific DNA-methyltransferase|nr:site-specific DNA-methyltransferase [Phycisphaerae bacterium]
MAAKKRPKPNKKIDTVRHKDKRKNIPTEELRDFVKGDENQPQKVLYPRDPDLDPQLVWKGKDEQDAEPLEVPAVPIYIQEKIHPQAIVEDFKRQHARGPDDGQMNLFADFNGLPEDFADRVDFYHHDGNWSNRMILGDSLLVMTSLAEKEALKGKVQMIYLDPPYGIKFGSNWQVSTRKRNVGEKASDLTRQPEQVKAFRDTWELGIHSYLAYLRDRLVVARELLTDTGSVFLQIGDENVHLVRCLLDEVFGASNFHAQINFKSTSALGQKGLAQAYDYILWYAKDLSQMKFRALFRQRDISDDREWRLLDDQLASTGYRRISEEDFRVLPDYKNLFRRAKLTSSGFTKTCIYTFGFHGIECKPFGGKSWLTTEKGMDRMRKANRLFLRGNSPYGKQYFTDFPVLKYDNSWADQPAAQSRVYVVQTARKFIERCLLMTSDPGDLVLDPTCGSGTTACVAENWGRRWITIDSSRVAMTLARTRLIASRFPYFLLADSPEGIKKESDIFGELPPSPMPQTHADVRRGFVCQRVPHITPKTIANNDEVDEIYANWAEELEPIPNKLNKLLNHQWEEWEMPREAEKNWPTEAKKLLNQWWDACRRRQKEIDESIARHSDQEVLYDRPYEDRKVVRVTGPFTVESLSPHRTISVEEKKRMATTDQGGGFTLDVRGPDDFGNMILENLRKAGVQNTFKGERLKFDHVEAHPGRWIQGTGEYTESEGAVKRAGICIGPEHGTVGPELVKEAAKEAVQGVGFDVLIVCGFAFDPHVSEEAKRYGDLVVLPTKMNPDLAMGELLKKTGSGNLFMVFGEPDIDIRQDSDGQTVVEVRGLDVYDPTTGEIRSSSTDDIACWFIDTNYNDESFFVRHAYFTGADQPYDKLKRALRAEIDESAWSELYSTTSRPFAPPETGKIAIKVINHYGDEVLKVYEV